MTPDQLLTFAAVAEHQNISRAAEAVHLSQPAVSGQLRLLQEEFGEPLYVRNGRGVRLTDAGRQLAVHAARLRDTWQQAHALRDALRGLERGTLRIGASTTPASYLLPYLVAHFHRAHPDIEIRTIYGNTSDVCHALQELDIALIEGSVPAELPADTRVHPWHDDEIVAIVPAGHPLASDGAAPLSRISQFPLIWRECGSGVRHEVERAFARAGASARAALELAGVEGVKEAVRAGMGVGFVSAMAMRHEDARLISVSLAPQPLTRRFSILVMHGSAASRAALKFLALCGIDSG
ncbi:LysR substrate-binding domain-containing protein [Mycetohabitans rhizoxinica]|uniref:LysR substrate-binding domain-containing protein n=1 Tax=Mycetohabitans rhizoxinica TaxID=412963 RepID=UPI0030D40B22